MFLPQSIKNIYLKNKIILINPGGGTNPGESTDVRQWGVKKYNQLIFELMKILNKKKWKIVLTGGKNDQRLCQQMIDKCRDEYRESIIDLSGQTSLYQLKWCIQKANIFITGDTGGMHIAASTHTPILSIFGPTDPREKKPLTEESHYIETRVDCHPCYSKKFTGCDNFICMEDISVEQIKNKILQMIEGTSKK